MKIILILFTLINVVLSARSIAIEERIVEIAKSKNIIYIDGCKHNISEACYVMGVLYSYGTHGVKKNPQKAEKYFLKTCKEKNVDGCRMLGDHYSAGILLKYNIEKAKKYWKKSCELGSGGSCFNLATTLRDEGNIKKAKYYYGKGCDLGFSFSCEYYKELSK